MLRTIRVSGTDVHTNNELHEGQTIHGSGLVVRQYKTLRPNKSMCSGCRDNFYNGHNDLGVKECWAFRQAKVVDKVGHGSIYVENGPDTLKKKTLSCWHAVSK